MNKTIVNYPEITVSVNKRMEEFGTPKRWLQEYLGVSYNTFEARLKKHNWKKSEINALKQINVL